MPPTKILRDKTRREVAVFTTPEGVRGVVATCIPREALQGLARKLERQLRTLQARQRAK